MSAGAGIVADSDPAFEQQECINKAKRLASSVTPNNAFASAAGRGQ
jgi:anthranilate synthase component 1